MRMAVSPWCNFDSFMPSVLMLAPPSDLRQMHFLTIDTPDSKADVSYSPRKRDGFARKSVELNSIDVRGRLAVTLRTMKAIRFHRTGDADVLTLDEVPTPSPGPGEVLIRVEAAGINFADTMRRRGAPYPEPSPLPFIPGADVAGTVEAMGQGVVGTSVGAPVFAATNCGGYAQYVSVPASSLVPRPPELSATDATSLLVQGLTAALILRHAGRLAAGDQVVVEAAAGGVGSFAVQLARLFGASKVIGLASNERKRAAVLELGADDAIDYTQPSWPRAVRQAAGGRGADLLLEMTGGTTLLRALHALAPFGRMVIYGLAGRQAKPIDLQRLVVPNVSVTGFYIGAYLAQHHLIVDTLDELIGYVLAGRLRPQIGSVLPLDKAAEAHRLIENRQTIGKVVLLPW
jgi:NADPH2:quinone reductase